jgi:alanyl-tRNA synthetase
LKILEVLESDGKKAQVLLDVCPFHESGGGQPGDTGTLQGDGFRADVKDARRFKGNENKAGTVLDLVVTSGKPLPGMEVSASVDLARNAILSRMHTGQHILSRLQENACDGLETVKVNIGVDESVVYTHCNGELTWDSLFDIEEQTAAAIRADIPVESLITSREEAEKFPELKAKWDRIHDEDIRVVRIAGVDATACSGTHVARTGEIEGFMITGFNGSPPDWEVRFTVRQNERVSEYSRVMRRLLREIGCRVDQVFDVFVRQREENAALRQVLDKVRAYVSIPWETCEAGNHSLHFAVAGGLTKELLSGPARNHAAEHPDTFCLVLAPGIATTGAVKEHFPFILLRGANLTTDLSGFIKKFPELEARGGGKPDWLNGMTTQRDLSVWRDCLAMLNSSR